MSPGPDSVPPRPPGFPMTWSPTRVTGASLVTDRYGTVRRNSWRSEITANVAERARMRVPADSPKSPLRYEASTRISLRSSARAGAAGTSARTATHEATTPGRRARARGRSPGRSAAAEKAILEAGIGRARTEPDAEQRPREVGPRDDPPDDALHLDDDSGSRQI